MQAAKKIARYIRYQRNKKSYSASELAEKSGLTPSFINRLENDAYGDLSFDVICKLALGLGMSVEELLRKSGLIENHKSLPKLEFYLKEKYQLPAEAIENVKLVIELMEFKHAKDIERLVKKHKKYWKKVTG